MGVGSSKGNRKFHTKCQVLFNWEIYWPENKEITKQQQQQQHNRNNTTVK